MVRGRFVVVAMFLMSSSVFSQIQSQKQFVGESYIATTDSTDGKSTLAFRRFQVYAGLGLPYAISIGCKYRPSENFFLEMETTAWKSMIKDGYWILSAGTSTTNYSKTPAFVFVDGEIALLLGKFPSVYVFSPTSGVGAGLSLRGELETRFGLALFMKIGVAKYFADIYGAAIFEGGMSFNF